MNVCMNQKLLKYDRIYVSEGIDVNKTNASKELDIVIIGKYEPYLWNGCHDLMQKSMNFNDVAIISIKGNYYRICFRYTSKDDAINLIKNSDLKQVDYYKFYYCI